MAIVVIPLHLVDLTEEFSSDSTLETSSLSCQIRLFFHLFVICVRSWSICFFMLLHYLHDGIIPTKHSVLLITFTWLISTLLILPTVLVKNSLVDFNDCKLLPQNYGMVFYVTLITYVLPSLIVTPVLFRWTKIRDEFSIRRDISSDFLDRDDEIDLEMEENIKISRQNSELQESLSSSLSSLTRKTSKATLNFLKTDSNLPRTLFTLALIHAILWFPFFILLIFSSIKEMFLFSYLPPQIVYLGSLWLGFAQSPLTPFLIYFLSDRVYHLLNSQAKGATMAAVAKRVRKLTFSEA